MRIVISQPMYFPWVGLLEQLRLSDIFVHYDDVQFARGFYNRVEVKTKDGMRWMTVPLQKVRRGNHLTEIVPDNSKNWRDEHRRILSSAYAKAPFYEDMMDLFDRASCIPAESIADISRASTMVLAEYFGLDKGRAFINSSTLGVSGTSSRRLLDICLHLGGTEYITGHGAQNYLDHSLFEEKRIAVEYMNYLCRPYPQAHPPFTPYVTSLDLVANCGRDGLQYICSGTLRWKEFLDESK
ncbi:WbqC family protein [Dokdonella sp.]|uniref:WbqC family protein n=1 Tax=Dokdonella sp. TaxID=2291710 RepID=UPI003529B74A